MPYPNPHDTAGLARLASQIEALRTELVPRLERIERQVERTNGRVTALELHDAREDGAAVEREGQRLERRRGDDRHWQVRMAVFGTALGLVAAVATTLILAYLTPLLT